jgi:hypothetical protein
LEEKVMTLTKVQRQKIANRENLSLDRISEDGGIILYRKGDKITCPGCGLPIVDVRPLLPCDYCEAVRAAIRASGGQRWGDVSDAEQKRLHVMADRIQRERG